ncbi:unnamed protein product [Periconia digitata]|uniref:Uncharacterized protein n=1 Tax=Periconia digitata TaxID=1303443 RepID=A0A9W4XT99_9PLEO|nr:unnamed protein product [Periconia digitata]
MNWLRPELVSNSHAALVAVRLQSYVSLVGDAVLGWRPSTKQSPRENQAYPEARAARDVDLLHHALSTNSRNEFKSMGHLRRSGLKKGPQQVTRKSAW